MPAAPSIPAHADPAALSLAGTHTLIAARPDGRWTRAWSECGRDRRVLAQVWNELSAQGRTLHFDRAGVLVRDSGVAS